MTLKKIIKKMIPENFRNSVVSPFVHSLESDFSALRYGKPAKKMRFIGVTGTNGKTTTSFMIYKMLHEAGINTGLMTTVANGYGDHIVAQSAHMTTAGASTIQRKLKEMKKAGVSWVVLETTSHALVQNRVKNIPYEIAVLTNVSHEHLDYHKTFDKYVKAKTKLFKIADRYGIRTGVVNADDKTAATFEHSIENYVTYGLKKGMLKAKNVKLYPTYSTFTAVCDRDEYDITCNIPGEFNISNALAAISVGRLIGLSKEQIEVGIASLKSVEGRMNTINIGQRFSVINDFAHTPDAFEKLLPTVRNSTKGKLVVVFGSAGRRDEKKRAIQGMIAGKYADEVIITEEDDRDVDGNIIMKEIARGAMKLGKKPKKDLFLILDRKKAIEFAMTRVSREKDTVLLLGKGHEKTIERKDKTISWNETEVAKEAIRKRLRG